MIQRLYNKRMKRKKEQKKNSFICSLLTLHIFIDPIMSQLLMEMLYTHLKFLVKPEKDKLCLVSLRCRIQNKIKLLEKDIRFVVTRGLGELDKGG